MTLNNLALLVGAFALVGCGSKAEDTSEPTDTSVTETDTETTETETETETTIDTAAYVAFWDGSTTAVSDGAGGYSAWDGTETFGVYNITEGSIACGMTYTMYSETTLGGCDMCSFAFDITMSDGTIDNGPGCELFGFADAPGEFGSVGFGLAPEYTFSYNGNDYTLENIFMYYYPGTSEWFGIAYADVTEQGADTLMDYTLEGSPFYYYTY